MNFRQCGRSKQPFIKCKEHCHSVWEIIYQTMGNTRAIADGKVFEMAEGDIIVIPPGTAHSTESNAYITDMWISFEKYEFPTIPFVVKDTDGSIRVLFEMLFNINSEKLNGYAVFEEKLAELICLYVKKASNEKNIPEIIS